MNFSQKYVSATSRAKTKFIGAVQDEWQLYSDSPSAYTIGPIIGFGASSIVYSATYHSPQSTHGRRSTSPSNPSPPIECALKVIDLDALPLKSLQLLKRETQLMSLSKHPNVLRVRGTWMTGHKLYIAMRLMKSGSVADVMRYGYPDGLEEDVCRCVLKQALEGLNYLHTNGFIHRDLKAANLLIDDDGTVLLGDLGVAVSLADDEVSASHKAPNPIDSERASSRTRSAGRLAHQRGKRRSFVGTPCWMAPEVVSQKHYDAKADIWSFGITALELTLGRAPRSRDPPHKVLMKTLNEAPPVMDRESGFYKYSKAFEEMVASCLMKDPAERPTAQQLLQSNFFRGTIRKSILVSTILKDLPPLFTRQERKHHAVVSAASSVASWDFDCTTPSVPTTPKHRKISTLFMEPSPVDKVDLNLQDDVLLETPELIPTAPGLPESGAVPFYPLDVDAKSEPGSEQIETESSSSSSIPSTPLSQSLDANIVSSRPPNPIPTITPELQNRKQSGMWKKFTGSRKTAEIIVPPSGIEKSSSLRIRKLPSRFLNNR